MNALENNQDRIFTKSFFLVFGALLFTALVMYALMSTVAEYATAMGSSATIAGLVSGIYIFGGLCSRIYSGNSLERVGWKKTALVFMTIHFISCILYFFVRDVNLLLIVRFIHGIGFGASANAIVTIATAVLPKSRFSEAFGYFMLGTTIAVGLGPFISGFLYDAVGANGCFLIASIFCALALICISFVDVSEKDPGVNSQNKPVFKEEREYSGIEKVFEIKAIPVSLFTALTSLGYISILSFNRLYAAEINLTTAFSWFFIIYSIVLVLSRPIAGKIQDWGGDRLICITGIIAQSIGLFLIAWIPSVITVYICAVCCALGFGTLNSACTTIVTRNVSESRRSYAVSTFFIFCDATMGFGPALLGSFVSASSGYAPVFFISSFITLLALPICLYALKN
ncbi:MAG: MFS transporter [Methanobrevibacter sp.]|uniref:MFS transporter n=1 Tax=Methanobrevibacter sp. TaxID=66852 RepID=UPI0025E2D3A4|nr:MFS transporter [Methanobrevibacter sp.]MBE6508619.1 MFS transporter [Methanobrevibacter sp.]